MKVINPTENNISVIIKGKSYSIEAKGSLNNVPKEDAQDWKTKTHHFIQLEEEGTDIGETVVEETPEEVTVEDPEELIVSEEDQKAIDEALAKPQKKTSAKKKTNKK